MNLNRKSLAPSGQGDPYLLSPCRKCPKLLLAAKIIFSNDAIKNWQFFAKRFTVLKSILQVETEKWQIYSKNAISGYY